MVAIIDYKAGNVTSVRYALEAAGASCLITADPAEISSAERIVFPGVGAARYAMDNLRAAGLADVVKAAVVSGRPFLGICLGTQVLFEFSEEDGGTDMLGILPGSVRRFTPSDPMVKVPEIGWNQVYFRYQHPLLAGIEQGTEFYFVHSYYPAPSEQGDIIGETEYAGVKFAAMVGRGSMAASQFHPEKSGKAGMRLIENFVEWDGGSGNGAEKPC